MNVKFTVGKISLDVCVVGVQQGSDKGEQKLPPSNTPIAQAQSSPKPSSLNTPIPKHLSLPNTHAQTPHSPGTSSPNTSLPRHLPIPNTHPNTPIPQTPSSLKSSLKHSHSPNHLPLPNTPPSNTLPKHPPFNYLFLLITKCHLKHNTKHAKRFLLTCSTLEEEPLTYLRRFLP